MPAKNIITAKAFRPLRNNVFVTDMEQGPSITMGGLIIPDDNMSDRGIRERWCRVWAIGPEVDDLKVGEWIMVKHGRWTLGTEMVIKGKKSKVWRVEYPEAVLLVSETDPRTIKPTIL